MMMLKRTPQYVKDNPELYQDWYESYLKTRNKSQRAYRNTTIGRAKMAEDNNSASGKARKRKYVEENREKHNMSSKLSTGYNRALRKGNPVSSDAKGYKLEKRCCYCFKTGTTLQGTRLCIDHKIPITRGGGHTLKNLQTVCERCNALKGNLTDGEFKRIEEKLRAKRLKIMLEMQRGERHWATGQLLKRSTYDNAM